MKALTINSCIIILSLAGYTFAGGFEEDSGPEELVSESNTNFNSETESLPIDDVTSMEGEEIIENETPSFTDSDGNVVSWSQGLVTTGADNKTYVLWGN